MKKFMASMFIVVLVVSAGVSFAATTYNIIKIVDGTILAPNEDYDRFFFAPDNSLLGFSTTGKRNFYLINRVVTP